MRRSREIIKAAGRPLTAFGACELRSPAPFTEAGFKAFNEIYIKTLIEWGIMKDGVNPVARSNVCPKIDPPSEPGFHAFSFTTVAPNAPASFVVAGSGESVEGKANYRDHTVRLGDTSPDGNAGKGKVGARRDGAAHERVLRRLEPDHRRAALYRAATCIPFLESELGRRGVFRNGLTWHFNRPPVVDLEYEMDCRRVHIERVVEV